MYKYDAIIAGGGLAGLVSSILMARRGFKVAVIEKKAYPFHKVCGEYVSNEVRPFLRSIGFNPGDYHASSITRLRISDPSGDNIYMPLDTGGFGLSRYKMDHALSQIAWKEGVKLITGCRVKNIEYHSGNFSLHAGDETFSSKVVIGSYGKRDSLDKSLNRRFIRKKTRYMAVKYHVRGSFPFDEVSLDNFRDGYCGMVKVEDDLYNICYLYRRSDDFRFSSVAELEEKILFKNPVIRQIFEKSDFVFKEPVVINQISFSSKPLVENHILMCGDSAGLITPLCGNGMSMAIHAASMVSSFASDFILKGCLKRQTMEIEYRKSWNAAFRRRLFTGRLLQGIFGKPLLTSLVIKSVHALPPLERKLVSMTHGKPF